MRACAAPDCGARFVPRDASHRYCAVCYRDRRDREAWDVAYQRGYEEGFSDGQRIEREAAA